MSTVDGRSHDTRDMRWRCWCVLPDGRSEITFWVSFEDADLVAEETKRQFPRTRYEIETIHLSEVRMAMGK